MPTNVVMPQMGESIAEGTIVRWIKKVGDSVDRDEPLFEISTDKVDAEIPSPAAGVLTEIRVKEGDTVPVDSVVAVIGDATAAPGPSSSETADEPSPESASATPDEELEAAGSAAASAQEAEEVAATPPEGGEAAAAAHAPQADGADTRAPETDDAGTEPSLAELREQKSSPVVRRIAKDHNVDLRQVQGTGTGGRVTKQDILAYLDLPHRPQAPQPQPAQPSAAGRRDEAARPAAPAAVGERAPAAVDRPASLSGERTEVVPMSVMRRKIAEHMMLSTRTSAHVYSVFEVDFTNVARIREARKAEFERAGAKLTYMAFIAKAVNDAIRAVPIVNASVEGDNIVYRKDINLGIAVALDWGLIVPVIKNADEKNVLGLSRAIADLAERARAKQLKPEEVQGGTFTITNPGSLGTLFGMPIINQPQVAILGVGAVEKRPVVINDAIAIRQRAYLTLGYDHRIIDGAVADQFMSHVKRLIENFDEAAL